MTDNVCSPRTRQSSASSIMSGRKNTTYNALKMSSASGRYSVSGRSNQSIHMIARSEYNIVESYGLPLPVLVNEALTFSEKNMNVSVNFSNNGWAWAVYGRQLLVWQYKDKRFEVFSEVENARTPQRRRVISQCRELTLPHCDIGHKASLIAVFTSTGHQLPSCIAVSPTGAVRYWPSIAHDGSSVDCTGILEGQEFDYLFDARPQGYLLVTTTCSLVLLQLKIQNGMCNIHPRAIKIPSGIFGSIGRKFASIIIGLNTNQEKENKFVRVTGSQNEESEWIISVLSDRWIQRWQFFKDGTEQLLFEDPDIIRKVREEFQSKFWSGKENNQIMVYLLDMQESDSKLFFLCGAVNTTYTSQMHYALVVMHAEESLLRVEHFYPLKLNLFFNSGMEIENLQLKFILHRGTAYIYGDRTIYLVNYSNLTGNDYETEKPEFLALNDTIMNADICSNIPLFFTRTHGLVCITPSDFDPSDFINSSCSPDAFSPVSLTESINQTITPRNTRGTWNLLMYELDPDELYNRSKEELCQLKAAFIYSLKRNTAMCNAVLRDIISDDDTFEQVDAKIDKNVITIAQDLAEDKPAADPRWEEKGSTKDYSLGSSTSVQILTQLREKEQALTHFLEFLHTVGIWEKLNASFYRGHIKSTCHILSDISEKIAGAISLKITQNNHTEIIEEAIRLVLAEWNECPTGNLVHQDLFYVKPTKFQDIYSALAKIPNKYIEMQRVEEIPKVLSEINDVVLTTLLEVLQYRERKMNLFALPPSKCNAFEYIPWTAESGKTGIKDTLLYLINITLKHGARQAGEMELKQRLYQQIVDLIDIVLDGRKGYLQSIEDTEQYQISLQQYHSQRRDLISTLVEDKQYELATKLAEKYLDFENLVVICDETQNQQRLDSYIEKFSDYNFSQIAIGWHLQQKKQGSLFDRFKRNQHALTQFLGDHPTLAWVQSIFNGNFEEAAKILLSLAQKEIDSVARKKTILSLAKLSILATNNNIPSSVVEINSELALIEYQEEIPEFLLQSFGFNTDNTKVLKPEEIIHFHICEENQNANEFDFRKALELLNYTEDPFEVRHKIWCAAIQRDSWTNYDMNSPMDKIQNLLFFKLIDMCYLMDGELEDFLPPMEDFLNSSELGDLPTDKSFQYLLKLVYEHISEYPNKNNVD